MLVSHALCVDVVLYLRKIRIGEYFSKIFNQILRIMMSTVGAILPKYDFFPQNFAQIEEKYRKMIGDALRERPL